MKKKIYYCMVLSEEQLDFLARSKYGIDRMKVLRHLIGAVAIKETKYEKKGFAVMLHIGQAALSEVDLANRMGYDKKTVSRLLDKMSALRIITSEQTNRTRDFRKAIHPASRGISEVCVCPVTRIAYVAQNRSALPCHISILRRSQARAGLVSFICTTFIKS